MRRIRSFAWDLLEFSLFYGIANYTPRRKRVTK